LALLSLIAYPSFFTSMGRPVALLDWIDLGGIRTPLYVASWTRSNYALLPTSVVYINTMV
jgi:hypothetical protein